MDYPSRIKQIRTERGLSISKAAYLMDIPEGRYRSYEDGKRIPNGTDQEKIANVLRIDIDSYQHAFDDAHLEWPQLTALINSRLTYGNDYNGGRVFLSEPILEDIFKVLTALHVVRQSFPENWTKSHIGKLCARIESTAALEYQGDQLRKRHGSLDEFLAPKD